MDAGSKVKSLLDEVRAIKASYEQNLLNAHIYTYEIYVGDYGDEFIRKDVFLDTDDGANALATIEGCTFDRMPYEGGAKFFLYSSTANMGGYIKLHSLQPGTVTVSERYSV